MFMVPLSILRPKIVCKYTKKRLREFTFSYIYLAFSYKRPYINIYFDNMSIINEKRQSPGDFSPGLHTI